ncbi:hypothetical protein [Pseudoxanthomonas winnipegensis]|uniref:Uncharacterized protein n=1 Tax=Pseudoxanthomonas winnipegensis TaxID=2480810 RepID=A0A4Q8M426_9GAMM|nr:hypothetical protein [Pseudoxanthomonas winnipegensis]TAA42505.1 hypothetical protein EA655_10790 [Pseudoxanthomonas winnipegensis]
MSGFQWGPNERELVEASRDIGCICEFNGAATRALGHVVAGTGKAVDELTVGELRALVRANDPDAELPACLR